MSAALKAVNDLKICPGGPAHKKYRNVHLECGYVDPTAVWRHNRCPIVADDGRCTYCARLENTLRTHQLRKRKHHELRRLRIPLSPCSKPKLDALRRQCIACYRSKQQLLKTKQKLATELSSCRDKLQPITESSLRSAVEKANLPEAQQMLLEECLSAARHDSPKERRYTDKGLLLRLLFHIQTPTGYRFLHDNDVLLQPRPYTDIFLQLELAAASTSRSSRGLVDFPIINNMTVQRCTATDMSKGGCCSPLARAENSGVQRTVDVVSHRGPLRIAAERLRLLVGVLLLSPASTVADMLT